MTNSPLPGWRKVTMWGMSPACDLLELIDKKKLGSSWFLRSDKKEINILLVGQKDIRHSLQTLKVHWKTFKKNGTRLNFYVVESCSELYARQMLFWKMAFKPCNKLELSKKVKQFGEVFGSSMVPPETWETVTSFSDSLINDLTGGSNSLQHWMPLMDLSEVAYQERSRLVEIIKFWTDETLSESFDMSLNWKSRIRQYLGTRYHEDFGLFFSDYYNNIVEKGNCIIGALEYDRFRRSGLGFWLWADWADENFVQPNLTLASSIGPSAQKPGFGTFYWGDILTGPFMCHGVECDDSSAFLLFEEAPDTYRAPLSTDITTRNLHDIFTVISNDLLPDAKPISDSNEPTGQNQNLNISVHFVSVSNFREFPSNLKYKEFFDVVYFGNSMIDELLPSLSPIFAPDVILLVENVRYAFDISPEEEKLFTVKMNEVATNMGFEQIIRFNSKRYSCDANGVNEKVQPSILKYVMKSQVNGFMFWIQRILTLLKLY